MTLKVNATKEQLAGLQAACDQYNQSVDKLLTLDAEAYWQKIYADVAEKDERPEQEVFDAACESYQSNFNVGLGTEAISKLKVTSNEIKRAEEAQENADLLKARYDTEVAEAKAESAALLSTK